tara:strand:- start:43 stop:405 length:363 start_codon:yes stop_codon:yes gene_type:complete
MNHRRPRRHRDKKKTTHSRKRYQLRHAAGPGPAADMLPGVAATMRPAGASVFPVFPAKILARFCHAVLDFREHQGLPPDLVDHAHSIAMPGTTLRRRLSRLLVNYFFEHRQKKLFFVPGI